MNKLTVLAALPIALLLPIPTSIRAASLNKLRYCSGASSNIMLRRILASALFSVNPLRIDVIFGITSLIALGSPVKPLYKALLTSSNMSVPIRIPEFLRLRIVVAGCEVMNAIRIASKSCRKDVPLPAFFIALAEMSVASSLVKDEAPLEKRSSIPARLAPLLIALAYPRVWPARETSDK